MKNIFLLIIILLFANNTLAQDISLTTELGNYKLDDLEQILLDEDIPVDEEILSNAKMRVLHNKEIAPWDGLLINPEGLSIIIVKYQSIIERANLSLETQRKSDLAKLNLETDRLKLELDAFRKKSEINLQGRDAELKSCQKINKEILEDRSNIRRKIFIGLGTGAGGLVLGTILGFILFH